MEWIGPYKLGLVDNLGDLDDAIAAAAKLAELDEDYVVSYIKQEEGFQEKFVSELMAGAISASNQNTISTSPLNRMLLKVQHATADFGALNDPNHAYVISNIETD